MAITTIWCQILNNYKRKMDQITDNQIYNNKFVNKINSFKNVYKFYCSLKNLIINLKFLKWLPRFCKISS